MSGPLQLIAINCPEGGRLAERLVDHIDRLNACSGIRVVDALLPDDSASNDEDFGAILSTLRGNEQVAALTSATTEAGTAYLLVEHRWAADLFTAINAEGGAISGTLLLDPELDLVVQDQLAVMEEAAESIAAAQAAEVEAWLRARAAEAEAAHAVDIADRVRSAAAAEALRALLDAGLVARVAAHEAADVLHTAGLVIAGAGEAAARAVAEDAETIAEADRDTREAIVADQLATAAADATAAEAAQAASVTPAEVRVLHYLPTKLTFALIADKLGVSRGAAKSRAERAYRKLDVHNRADAVARGTQLHLVPRPHGRPHTPRAEATDT